MSYVKVGFKEIDNPNCGLFTEEVILISGRPGNRIFSFSAKLLSNIHLFQDDSILVCCQNKSAKYFKELFEKNSIALNPSNSKSTIYFDDMPKHHILDLAEKMLYYHQTRAVKVVYVNCFGKESLSKEFGLFLRHLKLLARAIKITIIVNCELPEQFEKPSYDFEYNNFYAEYADSLHYADKIFVLHRPDYYENNLSIDLKNILMIGLIKNRIGALTKLTISDKTMESD